MIDSSILENRGSTSWNQGIDDFATGRLGKPIVNIFCHREIVFKEVFHFADGKIHSSSYAKNP
jgi:hypothetical protein